MTDLQAVCERHHIHLEPHWQQWAASWTTNTAGNIDRVERIADTQAKAVCALLKARWGIKSRVMGGSWVAVSHAQNDFSQLNEPADLIYTTELAAVVALADRLRGDG